MSWLDRKAQGWLRQHAVSVSVIDCDKGLGDALGLRSWMHGQICKQLRQGYVQLSPAAFQSRMSDFKHQADHDALFQFFLSSGAIAKADVDFLLSKFSPPSGWHISHFGQSAQSSHFIQADLQSSWHMDSSTSNFSRKRPRRVLSKKALSLNIVIKHCLKFC